MDKHYELFKNNLSWIQMDFKKLLENQPFITSNPSDKKSVDAKKVAIMMQKYLDQSPNMLYEILTRNLGKINITWDDLLKCLQDQFNLSYTVLRDKAKVFQYLKQNGTQNHNTSVQFSIQNKNKPITFNKLLNLHWDSIFRKSLHNVIFLQFFQKKDRIISIMDFKYRNVKQKLLKKHHYLQNQKNQARKNNESIDYMPLKDKNHKKEQNRLNNSKNQKNKYEINIRESNNLAHSEDITPSAQSKVQHKSRLNSNASSDISNFMKRYQTDVGVGNWKNKSVSKRETSIKIKTNTTKKVFQLFQNAKLQNSIEIAKKFQQSRDTFQQFMFLDKKLLQRESKTEIQQVTIQRHTFDFKSQLQKMKLTSKLMPKYKKSCSLFGENNKQNSNNDLYFKSLEKNKPKQISMLKTKGFQKLKYSHKKSQQINKSVEHISGEAPFFTDQSQNEKNQTSKLLEDNKIGVVSYSFYQNLLLVSLYNRQVRLYRIKKNLHKIKYELVFERHNESLITYLHIYKAIFEQTYNMILCSNRNNQSSIIKIYELPKQKVISSVIDDDDDNYQQSKQGMVASANNNKNFTQKDFKEIFSCRLSFQPIYQNLLHLGLTAFNQRGYLALIQTNNISGDCQNKSEKKIFEKQYYNTITGEVISFNACKVHSNMINLYLVCKNGFIYFVDKLTAKIKLLRKLSQYKILDLEMIKQSTEILVVSEKGELIIVNSQNLQPMYSLQTYMNLHEDSKIMVLQKNKYMFYGPRGIRVIQITENQQKLLQYQKPLKIYRNRLKIKKQQALLSKQTHEIQSQKQMLQNGKYSSQNHQFDTSSIHSKTQGVEGLVRESKMEKFKSRLNKRKIEQFYEVSNVQSPHYIMVLQNGEILVYNGKGEYYGSYLKNRGLQTTICVMNKKLHYLAILYSNSTVQIVNLYSQVSVLKLPLQRDDEQQLKMLKSAKVLNGSRKDKQYKQDKHDDDIIVVGFVDIVSGNSSNINSNKQQQSSSILSNQLIYTIDKAFTLTLMTFKGLTTKSVQLNNLYIDTNLTPSKSIANCTYWDRLGEIIVGNSHGQILFYQKNTLQYHRTIKLSHYPIIKIQPLTHNKKQKEKLIYLLCLTENNNIFIINKQTSSFIKIYQPLQQVQKGKVDKFNQKQSSYNSRSYTRNLQHPSSITSKQLRPSSITSKQLRPSSIQSKQRQRTSLMSSKQFSMKRVQTAKLIDSEGKVSSVHYFSKVVSFTQYFVVYQWEEIYQKPVYNNGKQHDSAQEHQFTTGGKSESISLKRTMQQIIKIGINKIQEKTSLPVHRELRQYKNKGYLIQKLPLINFIDTELSSNNNMTVKQNLTDQIINQQQSSSQFLTVFTNPNCYFLKICSTEDQFQSLENAYKNKGLLNSDSQEHNFVQTLNNPYQMHCFAQTNKITLVIQPQSQFRNIHFNSKYNTKNNTKNNTNKNSLINSSFNSRKNSLDSSQINNLTFNQNSFNLNKKTPQKTVIRIYNLEPLLKSTQNYNFIKDKDPFKILLEQEI